MITIIHTPGPWHLEGCEAGAVAVTDKQRLEPIAVFSGADRIGNAMLTALAPDMLDALRDLVDEFDRTNAARADSDKLGDSPAIAQARALVCEVRS